MLVVLLLLSSSCPPPTRPQQFHHHQKEEEEEEERDAKRSSTPTPCFNCLHLMCVQETFGWTRPWSLMELSGTSGATH